MREVRASNVSISASHTQRVVFGNQAVLSGLASVCANVQTRFRFLSYGFGHLRKPRNSSHWEMQGWLSGKRKYKNKNERKSAYGQLRFSPADRTHPTLKPWSRGDESLDRSLQISRYARILRKNGIVDNLSLLVQIIEISVLVLKAKNWGCESPLSRMGNG